MRSSRRTRRNLLVPGSERRRKHSRGEHTTRTGAFGGESRREPPFRTAARSTRTAFSSADGRSSGARSSPPICSRSPPRSSWPCSCSARSVARPPRSSSACCSRAFPRWIAVASLNDLYRPDTERTHHPTTNDLVGILQLVTVGTLLFYGGLSVGLDAPLDPAPELRIVGPGDHAHRPRSRVRPIVVPAPPGVLAADDHRRSRRRGPAARAQGHAPPGVRHRARRLRRRRAEAEGRRPRSARRARPGGGAAARSSSASVSSA